MKLSAFSACLAAALLIAACSQSSEPESAAPQTTAPASAERSATQTADMSPPISTPSERHSRMVNEEIETGSPLDRPVSDYEPFFLRRCVVEGDSEARCDCAWDAFTEGLNGRDDREARMAAYMLSSTQGTNLAPEQLSLITGASELMATYVEIHNGTCLRIQ